MCYLTIVLEKGGKENYWKQNIIVIIIFYSMGVMSPTLVNT